MTDDIAINLKRLSHERFHALWEIAKAGDLDLLTGEDKWMARIMLDHQDEFFNQFELADLTYDYEYDGDSEVNPFLHITLHSIVERQLEDKDPIEAYQFYNSMKKKGLSHHDIVHLIAAILTPLIFKVLQQQMDFDLDTYTSLLRKYKTRKPDKIHEDLGKDVDNLFGH